MKSKLQNPSLPGKLSSVPGRGVGNFICKAFPVAGIFDLGLRMVGKLKKKVPNFNFFLFSGAEVVNSYIQTRSKYKMTGGNERVAHVKRFPPHLRFDPSVTAYWWFMSDHYACLIYFIFLPLNCL